MPKAKKTTVKEKKPRQKKAARAKAEKPSKKTAEIKVEQKAKEKPERYFEAVGRRKTSIARIRLFTRGEKAFLINGKTFNVYFPTLELQQIAQSALEKMNCSDKFRIQVLVKGGGFHSQAEAVRHAISRALVIFNPDFRKRLKRVGYLTRDSRMRERKKFGLKRARKAPQWAKR